MRILSNLEIDNLCCMLLANTGSCSYFYYHFFELLYSTGLRYNDVSLCFNSSYNDTSFILKPSKHNNPRSILFSDVSSSFCNFVRGIDNLLYRIPYASLIREFKRCLPVPSVFINDKSILLHLFRHNYMKKLFLSGNSLSTIAQITGEKHVVSVSNYVFSEIKVS